MLEPLLPRRRLQLGAEHCREIRAVSDGDELPLVPGIGSPLRRHPPHPPFDSEVIRLVPEIRAQATVPISAVHRSDLFRKMR